VINAKRNARLTENVSTRRCLVSGWRHSGHAQWSLASALFMLLLILYRSLTSDKSYFYSHKSAVRGMPTWNWGKSKSLTMLVFPHSGMRAKLSRCLGGRGEDEVMTPSHTYGCGMRLNAHPKCNACISMGRFSNLSVLHLWGKDPCPHAFLRLRSLCVGCDRDQKQWSCVLCTFARLGESFLITMFADISAYGRREYNRFETWDYLCFGGGVESGAMRLLIVW